MFVERSLTVPPPSPFFTCICLFLVLVSVDICAGCKRSTETKPTPYVTDGEDAAKGRFPYMCSVRYRGRREHACGGTLIEKRWLLTAAHCLDPYSRGSANMNPLIYCDIYKRNEYHFSKTYSADATYIHGKWESNEVGNGYDIALIELDRVTDLPLPTLDVAGSVYNAGTQFSVLGWGRQRNNKLAEELQIGLNVEFVRNDVCSKDDVWGGYIKKPMICAGTGGVDTRKGDSGGPLLILDEPSGDYRNGTPRHDLLVGITSFGLGTTLTGVGPKPGVYTSVGFFREWIDCVIEGKVEKDECPAESVPDPPSADPSDISSDPSVDLWEAEESVPESKDVDPPCFEILREDFGFLEDGIEDKDMLERMKEAIEKDESVTVECILDAGMLDANAMYTVVGELVKDYNTSLLHHAASHNAVQSAQVLVDRGVDVDMRDGREQTPLHVAAERGSLDVAKVLIDEGANVNAIAKRGDSPLHFAAYYGQESIVKFLIQEGADVSSKNNNEDTPLDVVCRGREEAECDDETRSRLEDLLSMD